MGRPAQTEKLTGEILDRLYRPVGEIIIQWAIIDSGLTHLAFAMFKHLHTSPAAQGWPHSFGARVDALLRLFQKQPDFADLRADARQTLRDVKHHQLMRDMIVHGVAVRYHRGKDAVLFHRVDQTTKKEKTRAPDISHKRSEMLLQFKTLEIVSSNCTVLARSILALRQAVVEMNSKKLH